MQLRFVGSVLPNAALWASWVDELGSVPAVNVGFVVNAFGPPASLPASVPPLLEPPSPLDDVPPLDELLLVPPDDELAPPDDDVPDVTLRGTNVTAPGSGALHAEDPIPQINPTPRTIVMARKRMQPPPVTVRVPPK
jgi:hypothetical protein